MAVLDTNIFIRYLSLDNADQAERAFALLQELEAGNRTALLPERVLVEIVQVLSSKRLYNLGREEIRGRLSPIIRLPAVKLANKRSYLHAFDLYVDYSRLSFVDALCIAHTQREPEPTVLSFDRDFDNIPGVRWEEP